VELAQQIALWADKLRDLSAEGLQFTGDLYNQERYRAVQEVSMAMLALAVDEPAADLEPLRAPVFSHRTPFVGGDAAVIDDAGRILLIRRSDDGRWAMPGGALEVNETPAEGVLREVLEETGLPCQAVALVGVFDSRLCGVASRHHLYIITFLCRPVDGAGVGAPSHANEVLDIRWFAQDALPGDMHPGTASRMSVALRLWQNGGDAFFDGQAGERAPGKG
jgi:8-oxo-dGTP pyrophosphatase MutT (NUDIX family)